MHVQWLKRTAACLVVLAVMLTSIEPASAQGRWMQTVQVVIPLDEQPIVTELLDTLHTALQKRDFRVRRSPGDSAQIALQELRSRLDQDGLDFYSATHAFITYRFDLNPHKFSVDILNLHFIYRPARLNEADIPILYLEAQRPAVEQILKETGTSRATNQAAVQRFWDQLKLHKMKDAATVVQVGNEIIRDSTTAARHKQRILEIAQYYSYQ